MGRKRIYFTREEIQAMWRRNSKKYRESHRDWDLERKKQYHRQWEGIPEKELQKKAMTELEAVSHFPKDLIPDLYEPKNHRFIEIKRGLPFKKYLWGHPSKYFPGLFFRASGRHFLDEQIELYPRPLLVIIYNALTGQEIIRREFINGANPTDTS